MAKFESDITSPGRTFNAGPMKDVVIPDDSNIPQQVRPRHQPAPVFDEAAFRDFQAQMQPKGTPIRALTEIEQNILSAKKAKREGKERLSDGARKRIEMLLGMTRLVRDIEIAGEYYRVQTLTSEELRDAMTASMEFDGSVQFIFENRKQLLARALTMVAGVAVEQFLQSDDLDDKLAFIEQIEHNLLLRIFTEYNSLAQEAYEKYSPKTEKEVKEVMEDLKKS